MIIKLVVCLFMAMFSIFLISLNDYKKDKGVSYIESLKAHLEGLKFWVYYEIKKLKSKD